MGKLFAFAVGFLVGVVSGAWFMMVLLELG